MPLRNERQAYWDDIENHIARVQPLTASQAWTGCAPIPPRSASRSSRIPGRGGADAAGARLRALTAEAGARARGGCGARSRVEGRAFEEARRFVQGDFRATARTVNASNMRPERAARAASARPRRPGRRAVRRREPRRCADAHRERNERWGSGEVSPLMKEVHGGAATRRYREDAADGAKASAEARCTSESGGVRRDPWKRVETSDSFATRTTR